MSKIVYGGHNVYGYDIGVMMLDSKFPRIIGDVGNAKTWDFPVLYKKVDNYYPNKVVLNLTKDDIQPFIDAAKYLEKQGVKAITTSCGFLALFQQEIANEVTVPVFTSSLIMLPMVNRLIGNCKKILVLTANSETLTTKHIEAVCGNLEDIRMDIIGTQDKPIFTHFTVQNWNSVDVELCKRDILETIDGAIGSDSTYGAIVLECTNMPPFSDVIREKYGLPVFDFISLMHFIHNAVSGNGRKFE